MDLGLGGKVALICGGSRGIGKACAIMFAEEGARVIILSRGIKDLMATCEHIRNRGGEADFVQADLSEINEIESIVKRVRDIYGKVDVLVNNAGGPPPGDPLGFSPEKWEDAFRQNFLSAVELTRFILPEMIERRWGRVINITSITTRAPVESLVLSNGVRMAVVGWAKTLAGKYAKYGITINNVAPGFTLTERLRQLSEKTAIDRGTTVNDILESYSNKIPAGRLAEPWEIASSVVFLAGRGASYINGITLVVDGGYIPCV